MNHMNSPPSSLRPDECCKLPEENCKLEDTPSHPMIMTLRSILFGHDVVKSEGEEVDYEEKCKNLENCIKHLLDDFDEMFKNVTDIERESSERAKLLAQRLANTAGSGPESLSSLSECENQVRTLLECNKHLMKENQESQQNLEKLAQENCDLTARIQLLENELGASALDDRIDFVTKGMQAENRELRKENNELKEFTDNLRNDVDNLLKLSNRARDTGKWDPYDLNFCVVTYEQVCGPKENPAKVSERPCSCSSLNSKSSSLSYFDGDRSDPAHSSLSASTTPGDNVEDFASKAREYEQLIRQLRSQIVLLNKKKEAAILEIVSKDRIIADMELQFTEMNQEFDANKEECSAHLKVIQELKYALDELHLRLRQLETENELQNSLTESERPASRTSQFSSVFARRLMAEHCRLTPAQRECEAVKQKLSSTIADFQNLQRTHVQLQEEHERLQMDFKTLLLSREASKEVSINEEDDEGIPDLEDAGRLLELSCDLDTAKERLNDQEATIAEMRGTITDLELDLCQKDQAVNDLRCQCQNYQRQLQEVEEDKPEKDTVRVENVEKDLEQATVVEKELRGKLASQSKELELQKVAIRSLQDALETMKKGQESANSNYTAFKISLRDVMDI